MGNVEGMKDPVENQKESTLENPFDPFLFERLPKVPAVVRAVIKDLPSLPLLACGEGRAAEQKKHRLFVQKHGFDTARAVEISDKLGQVPLSQLSAGDHRIHFLNGREFKVLIPSGLDKQKNVPVVFLLPGVSNWMQQPENYVTETHLDEQAVHGKQKFILVTPLTEEHQIGADSTNDAYAWNEPGALIHPDDVAHHEKEVGYKESDYFAAVFKLLPKITTAASDTHKWAFVGGSQGAATLNRLVGESRFQNTFHNVFLVGGSAEVGDKDYHVQPYTIAPGNADHTTIVDTMGDAEVLPHRNKQSKGGWWHGEVTGFLGLDAVDSVHQDPDAEKALYVQNIAKYGKTVEQAHMAPKGQHLADETNFNFPIRATAEHISYLEALGNDIHLVFTNQADPKGIKHKLDIYELPTAGHVFPGSRQGTTSMIPDQKYEGFYTAKVIDDEFYAELRQEAPVKSKKPKQ